MLPSHQGEYPGRPVLAEAILHRRRERTFLVLATLFVAATAAMVMLGTSRIIDVTYALTSLFPELALPFELELPIGVLAFPISLVAVTLVCELYGRRRANALVMMGLVANLGLAGLMFVADRLDNTEAAFGPALAFTACYLVAHVSNLIIFDALRRRMDGRHPVIRKTLATLLAQLGGWAAFAFASYAYAVYVVGQDAAVADSIATLALGSALYVIAVALVDLIPFAIARRSLMDYLRVATDEDEEEIIELQPQVPAFIVREPVHPSLNLRTTGERRFFTEGEELSEPR
ncbi:MAG: VUT family protein [Deltaproteobacteria bacterium]|nr:VUT family protein [Deltaproteobacteria bacterium]